MARILAVDTTGELGSIALYDGEADRLSDVVLHSLEGFGHILFDRLGELLAREGWNIGDVECFASASGPGSFTGVRVGLTAAKGLAEAAARPVVPVSNLRALAWFGTGALRATLIDARRGEIYGAVYDRELEAVLPEQVTGFPVWLESLPEGVEFIGANIAPFAAALAVSRFHDAAAMSAPSALAGAIARIAHREFIEGRAMDPAAVDANYVRRSDAELHWKESR